MNKETEAKDSPPKRLKLDDENSNTETDVAGDLENVIEMNNDKSDTECISSKDIQKLRQFTVLDEVKDEEEGNDSDSFDDKSEDLPGEEIEKMLEENLPDDLKGEPTPKEKPYTTRKKIILEDKGVNQFDGLPVDWLTIRHHSGMPIYVHKTTRVCTISKPYCLGKGNIRRHDIPISAIPCFIYRRAIEEEEKQKKIDRKVEEQIKNLSRKVANQSVENHFENNQNKWHFSFIDKSPIEENCNGSVSKNYKQKCPFNNLSKPNTDNLEIGENSEIIKEENVSMEVKDNVLGNGENNEEKKLDNFDFTNDLIIHSEIINERTMNNLANVTESTDVSVSNIVEHSEEGTTMAEEGIMETAVHASNDEVDKSAMECDDGSDIEIPLNRQPVILPSGEIMPAPRVESVNNSWKTQCLTPEKFHDYCKRLFQFKTVSILQFNRWADRRKYAKAKKAMQYPKLPEGTKVITIPVPNSGRENGGKGAKRDWVMNMNSGSYLSVFHEYVCRALQKQPVYEYAQLENATTPYQATVYIGGMQYGVGYGSSKRQAKYAAAKASIHILIPEMREMMDTPGTNDDNSADADFNFFDYMGIEDPRIAEYCVATCEPSPHAILRTCLLRNFGAGDRSPIQTEIVKMEGREIEMTMFVGKHKATVVCKNKKAAKQRASQAILQALHPHVRSWGSLLRLYGSKSIKSCKEKKLEEQQITLLQDKARRNEPNYAVLKKLRNEMLKLQARDEAMVPIGTLMVTEDLPTYSGSNLNNVDI